MSKIETKLNIRLDAKTKKEAQKTLGELGLDLSSGVKLFLKSVIATQSIPFDVRTKNGYTLAQESKMIKESEKAISEYKAGKRKSFSKAKEMHKMLLG